MTNQQIEALAEKVLKETNCYSVPVKVSVCAKAKNIELKAVDLEDSVSGFFAIKNKVAHIGYNSKHPENRLRFTIAHELGHFVLHSKQVPVFIDKEDVKYRNIESSTGEFQKEREANAFAAALLMPNKLIKEEIQKYTPSSKQSIIEYLSNKFKVSEKSMEYRLTNLGLIDFGYF